MGEGLHPAAPDVLPGFLPTPGGEDSMLLITAIVMFAGVLVLGALFFWAHSLPERMAHKHEKLQMEIVAVLGLVALFSNVHFFWVAALLLAFIDFPGVMAPFNRIATALERTAPPAPAGAAPADAPTPPDLSTPPDAPPGAPTETASAERRDGEV